MHGTVDIPLNPVLFNSSLHPSLMYVDFCNNNPLGYEFHSTYQCWCSFFTMESHIHITDGSIDDWTWRTRESMIVWHCVDLCAKVTITKKSSSKKNWHESRNKLALVIAVYRLRGSRKRNELVGHEGLEKVKEKVWHCPNF